MFVIVMFLLCYPVDSDLPTIRGIDLNTVAVTSENAVPEFFEPANGKSKRKRWRKTVFKMPLLPRQQDSAFLYFPAGTDRFYINYRSDRKDPKTEKLFGPIEGHPFKVLNLESAMIAQLKDGKGYDVPNRLGLMLRTGDGSLSRRAFRVLYRMTELDVEGYTLESNYNNLNRIIEKYGEQLKKHAKPEQYTKFESKMVKLAERIESLVALIPDEEYKRAKDVTPQVPGKIDDQAWGESIKGLRMAAVPVESSTAKIAEPIYIHLILQNTSREPIRISLSDVTQNAQATVHVANQKQPARINGTFFTGVSPILRYHLEPGESVVVGKVGLTVVEDRANVRSQFGVSPVVHKFDGPELKLSVKYTLLPGYGSSWTRQGDGIMRRTSPARGEYRKGKLVTGDASLVFVKPAEKKEK